MGITWSMTSSADGFAPPAPSVGLNLKIKRLMGSNELPRRKNPRGETCDGEKITILVRGSDTYCPGGRSQQECALCAPRQRQALSPGRTAEVNARRRIRRPPLLPPWGEGNSGRLSLWLRSRPCPESLRLVALVRGEGALLLHVTADLASFTPRFAWCWDGRECGRKRCSLLKG